MASSTLHPDAVLDALNGVSVATLASQLRRRGFNDSTVDGVRPARSGSKFAGRARTLRYLPQRPDLFAERGTGYNAQKRAIDALRPNEVLVMDARGEKGTGTIGDIMALRAHVAGAAAVVTDGGLRDAAIVSTLDLPVFHAGSHPAVLGRRHIPWDTDITIACGGATVTPGDILVGDDDGVVVIPASLAEEILADSLEQEQQEDFMAEHVASGALLQGLYPLTGRWLDRYKEWTASRARHAGAEEGLTLLEQTHA